MAIDADDQSVRTNLLAWARGIYPTEAATRLLLHAFEGRFARPGWPWIRTTESGSHYIDTTRLHDDEIGMLSGGERRVLAIARSLFGEEAVNLADALTGLDRPISRIVLSALTHATGTVAKAAGADRTVPPAASVRNSYRDRSTATSR